MMKHLLFLFALSASLNLYSQESELTGKWELIKIETQTGVLYPQKKDYFLDITAESLNYNLEVNTCKGTYSVEDDRIIYGDMMCSFVCCDGREDPIAKHIRYDGAYTVFNNQMVIITNETNLYLERR